MKRERRARKTGFRYLASFVTENWWLKLLALALATIIYQSLKSDFQQNQNQYERYERESRLNAADAR